MSYKTIYTDVEVDIDLDEFDDEELIEELEKRGLAGTYKFNDCQELLRDIFEKRRLGKDYQHELDQLIYHGLGKII